MVEYVRDRFCNLTIPQIIVFKMTSTLQLLREIPLILECKTNF